MINFDYIRKENIKTHNPNWPKISNHPYRISIIGGFGSGKTNALFKLIIREIDNSKIYFYAKDPHEGKYQLLIEIQANSVLKHCNK